MNIREIRDPYEKQMICRTVLEALADWFEIEEARESYIAESASLSMFAAFEENEPAGFITLKQTGQETCEIHVMGIRIQYQRRGIGKKLFEEAKRKAADEGFLFLQVKTVQAGTYPEYDQTNRFYQSLGFHEFEVIPQIWGEENPCQVYVMYIGKHIS